MQHMTMVTNVCPGYLVELVWLMVCVGAFGTILRDARYSYLRVSGPLTATVTIQGHPVSDNSDQGS
jgi:hypothetical protein